MGRVHGRVHGDASVKYFKKNRQFLKMSLTKYGDREQRRRIRRAIEAIVTRSENLESKDLITPTKISTSKNRLSSFSNRKNLKRLSLKLNLSTRNFSTKVLPLEPKIFTRSFTDF